MAVLPVKWNWEDALDKKNQEEHDGSSTYIILESLSDNISEIQDSIYGLQKDIYKLQDDISKMKNDIYKTQRRQANLESQMRKVIKKSR